MWILDENALLVNVMDIIWSLCGVFLHAKSHLQTLRDRGPKN